MINKLTGWLFNLFFSDYLISQLAVERALLRVEIWNDIMSHCVISNSHNNEDKIIRVYESKLADIVLKHDSHFVVKNLIERRNGVINEPDKN